MDFTVRVNGEPKLIKGYTATRAVKFKCRDCYGGYKGKGVPDCGIDPAPDSYAVTETGICELMRWWVDSRSNSKIKTIRKYWFEIVILPNESAEV